MDINSLFPSNYLKAVDLKGAARRVTIASVAVKEISQGESKPVIKFTGVQLGLVLNKTNAQLIAAHFGGETTTWTGKEIELYPDKVPFQGRIVDAIRVRAVPPPAAAPVQLAPAAVPPQTNTPPAPAAPVQAAPAPAAEDDLNDDIPW